MRMLKYFSHSNSTDLPSETIKITVDGAPVSITIKRHARARRFILKYDPRSARFKLTIPPRATFKAAVEFAHAHVDWIEKQHQKAPEPTHLVPGSTIPLRGTDHIIRHTGLKRGTVRADTGGDRTPTIWVSGGEAHSARRIGDWLKDQARQDLVHSVDRYAALLALKPKRIAVRDQSSRWGSCSTSGTLSFSWRLILAPEFVLDYVAAHEVAHLKHMDHSAAFWALVNTAIPEMNRAKSWLRTNGQNLHRVKL